MSAIACSTSPRYSGAGRAGSTRAGTAPASTSTPAETISPSSSRSGTRSVGSSSAMPNGLTDHQASPRSSVWWRTSASERYDAAPRSTGA